MDFKDLLDYCKAEAIYNTLSLTEVSVWRTICRNYSKKFSTPLHMCLNGTIPPEEILLAELEDQLSNFDPEEQIDDLLEEIYMLEDPEYESDRRKEVDDFVEQAEAQEAERVKLGKPIHKGMKEEVTLKPVEPQKPVEAPKKQGGFIDLSYLSKEDSKGNGFRD